MKTCSHCAHDKDGGRKSGCDQGLSGSTSDHNIAITKIAGPIYPSSLSVLMHTSAFTLGEWNKSACIGVVIIVTSLLFVALYARMARMLQGAS